MSQAKTVQLMVSTNDVCVSVCLLGHVCAFVSAGYELSSKESQQDKQIKCWIRSLALTFPNYSSHRHCVYIQ